MNVFTASNGTRITEAGGETRLYLSAGANSLEKLDYLGSGDMRALREFFQAEADERLGRWRWPENRDHVVYPRESTATQGEKRRVRVIHEPSGDFMDTVEGSTLVGVFKDAARAYFDAHPEPKPWHDAVEGEVWILMFRDSSHAWFVNGGFFQSAKTLTNITKTDEGIIAGRRIFPEEVQS